MKTVEEVQAAEEKVIQGLRMLALTLALNMRSMCEIFDTGKESAPSEVQANGSAAWFRLSGGLEKIRGIIDAILCGKASCLTYDSAIELADICETALDDLADPETRERTHKWRHLMNGGTEENYVPLPPAIANRRSFLRPRSAFKPSAELAQQGLKAWEDMLMGSALSDEPPKTPPESVN